MLRRQPAQRRGVKRVDDLLDACGGLLDELGYDGLTTRAVADRAGSSVGSFYQFFEDKQSLVRAFGQRNLDVFLARITERFATAPPADWTAVLDDVLDEYIAMRRTVPGFGVVDFLQAEAGTSGSAQPISDDAASDRVAEHVGLIIAEHLGDERDHRLALRVAVETADALVRLAFRADPDGDPQVLAETRRMIANYLAQHFDPSSPR